MKKFNLLINLLILWPILFSCAGNKTKFYDFFIDKTMRFDYYHTGDVNEEHFAFDMVVSDGIWAGSKTELIDNLELGKYFFRLFDKTSGELIYSSGFASIYGEWETIPDAKTNWGVFHESIRFPWPKNKVKIVMAKRNNSNNWDNIWEYDLDPQSRRVNPAYPKNDYEVYDVLKNGEPEQMVDIVILGDGYKKEQMKKFRKDADAFTKALLGAEPFKSKENKFNIRAVETPSAYSGINRPHPGVFKRSTLSASFSAFDSERYVLAYDNRRIRDVASSVPYDFTVILINDSTYGGGGIYNLYITASVDNAFSEYIFVHEFGHHFAGLADEYYTASIAYELDENIIEPWELNITTITNYEDLKWKDLVEKDTPLPTPWEKAKYEEHSKAVQKKRQELRAVKADESLLESLFKSELQYQEELFSDMKYNTTVGAFEGAGYYEKGVFRSAANCIMFTRKIEFCPACQRAINLIINKFSY